MSDSFRFFTFERLRVRDGVAITDRLRLRDLVGNGVGVFVRLLDLTKVGVAVLVRLTVVVLLTLEVGVVVSVIVEEYDGTIDALIVFGETDDVLDGLGEAVCDGLPVDENDALDVSVCNELTDAIDATSSILNRFIFASTLYNRIITFNFRPAHYSFIRT